MKAHHETDAYLLYIIKIYATTNQQVELSNQDRCSSALYQNSPNMERSTDQLTTARTVRVSATPIHVSKRVKKYAYD